MNPQSQPTPPPPQSAGSLLPLAPGIAIADSHLRIQFSRGSGPGGQNVNKVNTKAELWIPITQIIGLSPAAFARLRTLAGKRLTSADELHLASDIHRTQDQNRRELFDRLRELLIEAKREPRRRRKTRPTAASKRRRLESKRQRSELKAHRSQRD